MDIHLGYEELLMFLSLVIVGVCSGKDTLSWRVLVTMIIVVYLLV